MCAPRESLLAALSSLGSAISPPSSSQGSSYNECAVDDSANDDDRIITIEGPRPSVECIFC